MRFAPLAVLLLAALAPGADDGLSADIGADELREHVRILASDEYQGRRAGAPGGERAAEYVAARFAAIGLAPGGDGGTYFARLPIGGRDLVADSSALAVKAGGKTVALAPGADFEPFSFSMDVALSGAPVVFLGYGLRAPDLSWDDYAGQDVKGKIAVILRRGPSVPAFSGGALARLTFEKKARAAKAAGAAAVLLLDDRRHHPDEAGRCPTRVPLMGGALDLPFLYLKPAAADALFAAAGVSLADLEAGIDRAKAPASCLLAGVTVDLSVVTAGRTAPNVVGFLPGGDERLAAEAVVIGAHYDHVGTDGAGGIDAGDGDGIWNGADDNASGTAALIEIAEQLALATPRPARTIVFVAFTGEELGLLGSAHYVAHPVVPIGKTAAMLNLDMVGRSRENRVTIGGTGTAAPFVAILTAASEGVGLSIRRSPGDFAPSDSLPFAQARVPSLFFFAGMHPDYHRTTDTFEKLDYEAGRRIAVVAAGAARRIADLPEKPPYVAVTADARRGPRLGVSLSEEDEGPGVLLAFVMDGSAAAKAGLLAGDRVVAVGGAPIRNGDDLVDAIRSHKPGDEVEIEVRRDGKSLTVAVKLAGR